MSECSACGTDCWQCGRPQQPSPEWQDGKPTDPGWYWVDDTTEPRVVHVHDALQDGELQIEYPGSTHLWPLRDDHLIAKFAGPIQPPDG